MSPSQLKWADQRVATCRLLDFFLFHWSISGCPLLLRKGGADECVALFVAHLCGLRPTIVSGMTYRGLKRWQINEPVETDSQKLQDCKIRNLTGPCSPSPSPFAFFQKPFALFLQLPFPRPPYQPPGLTRSYCFN